jgi:hypothetical protein
MNPTLIRKTLMASSVALALGAPNTQAALVTNVLGANTWSTDSANFTLLTANASVVSGTNDVNMFWDGNGYSASSDYTGPGGASNVTLSSATPFFGHIWMAHDIQVFTPGSYSFDVTLGVGNPEAGFLTATVGASQLGMHMLWDWNGNLNIDVFVVLAQNSIFGSGLLYSTQTNSAGGFTCDSNFTGTITKNCLYDGPGYGSAGAPTKNQVWKLASVDGNGDGVMGIPTAPGGPITPYNFNFNANLTATPKPVPVPAALWLFGSGLMGLIAAARRRKKSLGQRNLLTICQYSSCAGLAIIEYNSTGMKGATIVSHPTSQ